MAHSLRFILTAVVSAVLCACHRPSPHPIEIQGVKNVAQAGHVYVAGAPTEAGLREMKARGVTTVIDLRGADEGVAQERAQAVALGLNYIHIPMQSDQMTSDQARAVVDGFETHKGEKILLHCAGGNRAGAAYGVYLGAQGCKTDEAIRMAERAGLKNEALKKSTREQIETRR